MKRQFLISYLAIVILCLCTHQLLAQYPNEASIQFNQHRININKHAMLVLGGWATANLLTGTAFSLQTSGERKYFHQMNAYWNTVNLAIAGWGYYQAMHEIPSTIDLASTVQQQYAIQQALLLNVGLDIAYLVGGAYLIERSKNSIKHRTRLKGFGKSVILQGGFLLAFDIVVYGIHQSRIPVLEPLLSHIKLSPNGIGLYWQL